MIASLDLEKSVGAGNLGWGTGSVSATIWDGDINDRLWQLTRLIFRSKREGDLLPPPASNHATTCVRLRKDPRWKRPLPSSSFPSIAEITRRASSLLLISTNPNPGIARCH